eukprot:CAMPEP_0197886962 /NCGR_PEP_ID=MMETSP1439-20131203/18514_1 /TAXON_ID=66791 /ORGANISM="Gonyaulax spinifera, Strain CCMP409" /LENGTH=43 /DNA_ID= /DNA_START= /DNA_END= /DNA_ORIENTATION=
MDIWLPSAKSVRMALAAAIAAAPVNPVLAVAIVAAVSLPLAPR